MPKTKLILAFVIALLLLLSCDQIGPPPSISEPTKQQPTNSPELPGPEDTPTSLQPILPTEPQPAPSEAPIEGDPLKTPSPTQGPEETGFPPPPTSNLLAYLAHGDLYLAGYPDGAFTQISIIQLTTSGDNLSFAWIPNSDDLLVYRGYTVCRIPITPGGPIDCINIGIDDIQATIERQITISPDGRYAALWNPFNPWDEEAIGWLVIDLGQPGETWQVLDPVDWGAQLAPENQPGGVTGQTLFLNDGSLVGTLTHRWLCTGTTGCRYQLFTFDFINRALKPFPNNPEGGFSEGLGLVGSDDGRLLLNHGTFHSGCETYFTFVDIYDLQTKERRIYDLEQVAINGLALAPDNQQAVISRNAGCSTENQTLWAQTCGISQGFDIYNMQIWNLAEDTFTDIYPGIQPDWSPNGQALAFRSCLTQQLNGDWTPGGDQIPSVFLYAFTNGDVILISEGQMPQWKP